jgi:hypothetical protein
MPVRPLRDLRQPLLNRPPHDSSSHLVVNQREKDGHPVGARKHGYSGRLLFAGSHRAAARAAALYLTRQRSLHGEAGRIHLKGDTIGHRLGHRGADRSACVAGPLGAGDPR